MNFRDKKGGIIWKQQSEVDGIYNRIMFVPQYEWLGEGRNQLGMLQRRLSSKNSKSDPSKKIMVYQGFSVTVLTFGAEYVFMKGELSVDFRIFSKIPGLCLLGACSINPCLIIRTKNFFWELPNKL